MELATQSEHSIIESVVINGDLSKLTSQQRVSYYQRVCTSLGLNPLTRPFDYITLNSKLTLYARKDATDQLRRGHEISIEKPDIRFEDEWIIVTVTAHDKTGRTDSDVGVVKKTDMNGNMGNALMKAVTKAKRRVTLSIVGLGWLDETEVETIPDARPVVVAETGEILPAPSAPSNGKSATESAPAGMTIEEAEEQFSTTANAPYGTLPTETLAKFYHGLSTTKKELTQEQAEKKAAIEIIMAARKDGRPVIPFKATDQPMI